MSNLSPHQFPAALYHGTVQPLEGDTLLPRHKRGVADYSVHPSQPLDQNVSATSDEDTAWRFASMASGQSFDRVRPRTRVHELAPNEHTRMGVENIDHPDFAKGNGSFLNPLTDSKEWVAPSFKVRQTHDIRPGSQGTFPQVNWNRYAKPSPLDANHPYDQRATRRDKDKWGGNFFDARKLAQQYESENHAGMTPLF